LRLPVWSIRTQLFLPLALAVTGGILSQGIAIHVVAKQTEMLVLEQLQQVVKTVTSGSYPLTDRVLEQLRGLTGSDFLLESSGILRGTIPFTSQIQELLKQPSRDGDFFESVLNPQRFRIGRVALMEPHPNAGSILWLIYPETRLNETVNAVIAPSFASILIGVLAGVISFGLGNRVVRVIRQLQSRTQQIAKGDFTITPNARVIRELDALTESLNEMVEQLAISREKEKETERLRLTGQLASGLAHQLRNSATGAKLALQVHHDECPGDHESLEVVRRQIRIMESLVRRFLELGKVESIKQEVISLASILMAVQKIISPQIDYHEIDLNWPELDANLKVMGDFEQLSELCLNVLGNAVEAAGPGGKVWVFVVHTATHLILSIMDSGTGPPESIQDRLFEPFITGKPEGLGLGLALAKQAIERCGGMIEWDRFEGKTRFQIYFPIPATFEAAAL
jgi:signal transduction histidine kinase